MRIAFKAKPVQVYNPDGSVAYVAVKVPELKRSHVDMHAARRHPRYSGIANSDLFPGVLAKIRRELVGEYNPSGHVRLDKLPEGFSVRRVGPLIEVSWEV